MKKCIYCGQTEVNFNREHVVPQFLGYFNSTNFVLDGIVCTNCNSKFSKIEGAFQQDSMEGILAQQLNVARNSSSWITGKRLKINSEPGFDQSLHKDMFPFLKIENGRIVVDINRPHVKIKDSQNGYRIFQFDELERIADKGGKDFIHLCDRISKLSREEIVIFLPADGLDMGKLDEATLILKRYGINYIPGETKFANKIPEGRWMIGYECTLDRDLCRVLTKIVFNYFTYCMERKGMVGLVYRDEFNKTREFICGNDSIHVKEILFHHSEISTLEHDKPHPHLLYINVFNKKIIASISLFGRRLYTIMLGELPPEIDPQNIVSFHIFDPFSHTIE